MVAADGLLSVLLNEKSVTAAERQQLVNAQKQSIAFLGVILGLLFDRGFAGETKVAFVAVPFIVLAGTAYIYSNTVTMLYLTIHLERVDLRIKSASDAAVPMWHSDFAAPIADAAIVVTRGGKRMMNPYYALTIVLLTVGLGAAIVGTVNGFSYISSTFDSAIAWLFLALVFLETLVVVHGFVLTALTPLDDTISRGSKGPPAG